MWLRRLRLLSPDDDAGALAAVNAALSGDTSASTTTDGENADAKAGGDDGGQGGSGTGDEAAAAGGEGAAGGETDPGKAGGDAKGDEGGEETAEEAAAAVAAGETRERGPDGRFLPRKKAGSEAGAGADGETAAGKAKKPAAGEIDLATGKPRVAAKAPDHINDPIPADVKGRTKERIEGLVATAKDLTTKLETASTELNDAREVMDMIEATGASPEIYAKHLHVLQLMHSTKLEDRQAVLGYLRKAADLVATQLGETPSGKDALEGHQDLIDEVEGGTLTRARAEELATARNRDKAAKRLNEENNSRSSAQAAAAEAERKTTDALNNLSKDLRKRDGEATYARKHALLVPFIKRLRRDTPPDEIVAAVREAYEALKLGPAVADGTARVGDQGGNGKPKGQPLRHTQGAAGGGHVKQPGSAIDAVNNALEELTGRGAA